MRVPCGRSYCARTSACAWWRRQAHSGARMCGVRCRPSCADSVWSALASGQPSSSEARTPLEFSYGARKNGRSGRPTRRCTGCRRRPGNHAASSEECTGSVIRRNSNSQDKPDRGAASFVTMALSPSASRKVETESRPDEKRQLGKLQNSNMFGRSCGVVRCSGLRSFVRLHRHAQCSLCPAALPGSSRP